MSFPQTGSASFTPLESVIITQELARRPARKVDSAAINRALVALAQTMANSPERILQRLAEAALDLCGAHSSGISLLEEENGKKIFRWHGVAGQYAAHLWGTTPRDFSPCGTVLDTDAVQLMSYLDRHFEYFAQVKPRIAEALLVPFHVHGQAVGTIWVISHDQDLQFSAADVQVMKTLGEFTAAAYQVVTGMTALEQVRADLETSNSALHRTNQELEAHIVERGRAEAKLSEANSDLAMFGLAASHDLQEPLRTITVFTQLLNRRIQGTLDSETGKLFDTIVDGASRMKSVIDSLLEYSQIVRAGATSFTPISLHDVATDAIDNLHATVSEQGAAVTLGTLPIVYGDRVQLTLLLQNLIGNALRYRRPEEAPRIHISAEPDNDNWVISVRDNGEGFLPEYAEMIFRPFKRLHGKNISGTGIGLTLCKRVVERHGGTIWATSKPGEGSTFRFTLPVDTAELSAGSV